MIGCLFLLFCLLFSALYGKRPLTEKHSEANGGGAPHPLWIRHWLYAKKVTLCWPPRLTSPKPIFKILLYRVDWWTKKFGTLFVSLRPITSIKYWPILKLFSLSESGVNTITKDPTAPQVCRYTALWNVSVCNIVNKTTSVTTHFKTASSSSNCGHVEHLM